MKKVLMAFVFCLLLGVSVQAKEVLPTDKTTAGEGCTLVGVEGEYITQAEAALNRINEIRKEACKEGVQDPRNNSRKLTENDYVPIKWSSDLEYIARIRAAEATVVDEHTRPNGSSCFTLQSPNGQQSGGEVLAWNYSKNMVDGINQWYSEKADWVKQTAGAVTGHYTQMIDPSNTYVGLGDFYNPNAYWENATAGEFSANKEMDATQNTMSGECIQTIEVKDSSISLNISLKKINVEAKEETQAKVSAAVSNCPVSIMGNVIWSSSNNNVATVDKNGKITGIDYGTATITAKSGTLSQTVTVNVTTHDWNEQGDISKAPTCKETGEEIFKCKVCNETKTESIPANGHREGEVKDAKAVACKTDGYTGDTYCAVCHKLIKKGETIPATGHQWDAGKVTKAATYTEMGIRTYTCKSCSTKRTKTIDKLKLPKVGTIYTIDGKQYKVTKEGEEVSLIKGNIRVRNTKIPDTITIDNLTYKVTAIATRAFKKSKNLRSVVIGKNIRKISNNAFFKCKSLKSVKIKTTLLTRRTASKRAFSGAHKRLTIKVPPKMLKSYKKIFEKLKVE